MRWLAGLPLGLTAALAPGSGEHLPFQAGAVAEHWCIHDLFRALGVIVGA
ncbi:hypothetical protein PKB_0235 [Pseudomonas knackmussii B13]|uniref:Uncharacterized protein n=1 Tax=Pseudomonas knackmussii (strain DSM 6978 / CCUG 54928 / LMG 23759 / B13) TaxID=1301098 RepID=A0A024HAM4_PSEKB|nr:hypothetical protein [Pseudomonas knackmussii]CDF81614.1 hypothetical protein PKB_0235 [Pseudomonas knackmussii B13]